MNNTNYKIGSIYIPKKHYILEDAKSFLKHHKYKINKIDDSDTEIWSLPPFFLYAKMYSFLPPKKW